MAMQPLRTSETATSTEGAQGPQKRFAPRHVAVILDGNRRRATAHGQPLTVAYQLGATRVHQLLQWCEEAGVPYVTVWALSKDNLQRRPDHVAAVLDAVAGGLEAIAATGRWPIRLIGALGQLPVERMSRLRALAHATAQAPGTTLTVALAYNGRHDITQAVRTLLQHHTGTDLDDADRAEQLVGRYLSTAGQPDIDLVIRTSGEQRLSGFMPWQSAHAELYFTPVPWPDFTRDDFCQALRWFAGRQRRHGR